MSSLAWSDYKKEVAAGFSDGVVRIFSIQPDTNNVTVDAHKVISTTVYWW